jgi:hypothetical protein
MRRYILVLVAMVSACIVLPCVHGRATASDSGRGEAHGLALSNMKVSIASRGRTAIFRLYDTAAAKEFYDQLPLQLPLTNFRDAQWMFYPPRKLNVTAREAYHDGKKGELSYYAAWGDVFMLYKDFHAGEEMHRLEVGLSGIDGIEKMSGRAVVQKIAENASGAKQAMQITVKANGKAVVFELNNSPAAKDLRAQLPLDIKVENYGGNEKIFYPPKKLTTTDTPLVKGAQAGTLAYYAPWGDVVMFYGRFGAAAGLYELGRAISGSEHIQSLSGTIRIEEGRNPAGSN